MAAAPEGLDRRVAARFERVAVASARYAAYGRTAAVAVVGLWLAWSIPAPFYYYYEALLAAFIGIGWLHFLVSRNLGAGHWLVYVLASVDMALLTFAVLSNNPFSEHPLPAPLLYRFDNFVFFFLLFASVLHSYAPRLVLWSGFSIALCWGGALAFAVRTPGVVTEFSLPGVEDMSRLAFIERAHELDFIEVMPRLQEMLVAVLVAVIAAFAVARSRRLVLESVRAERARENLARYFSPEVAAELASDEHDLGAARRQHAAVLFADIVGFTRLSEALGPEGTIALLREWHGRLGDIVFRHGGTLDKYIGDGLMATFGTPRARPDDASRALDAALEMAAAVRAHAQEPRASRPGPAPVRLGIGLHYGPVVLGDVGNARRLEFAVLGDTVNVASRLEGLTRALEADLAASAQLVARVREEGGEAAGRLVPLGARRLRGREEPIEVFVPEDRRSPADSPP